MFLINAYEMIIYIIYIYIPLRILNENKYSCFPNEYVYIYLHVYAIVW